MLTIVTLVLLCTSTVYSYTAHATPGMTEIWLASTTIDTTTHPHLAHKRSVPKTAFSVSRSGTTPLLIQLTKAVTADERRALEVAWGVSLDVYVPRNTFLVSMTHEQAQKATDSPFVQWVGAYPVRNKAHGECRAFLSGTALDVADSSVDADILPGFTLLVQESRIGRSDAQREALRGELIALARKAVGETTTIEDLGATQSDTFAIKVGDVSVAAVRRLISTLAADDDVVHIEKRVKHGAFNKYSKWLTQGGVKGETPIWNRGIRGQNQVVGCADSGLDADHCFFDSANRPRPFSKQFQKHPEDRKVIAYFADAEADYVDDVGGHGTHVAGSILGYPAEADQNARSGARVLADYAGMAPDAKLVFHDIGKTGSGGLTVNSDTMDRDILQPAYDLGARIHTNSWGCSGNPSQCNTYSSGAVAVDKFVWENKDMAVLFAAGNDGQNPAAMTQTVGSPATAKNSLVIGAAQSTFESFQESLEWYDWLERQKAAEDALNGKIDCCNPPSTVSDPRAVRKFCCRSAVEDSLDMTEVRHNENNVAEFSSRGPTYDGRIKPDMLAPGQNIISSHSDGDPTTKQCGVNPPELNNNAGRLTMQGTSMATPTAAGSMALVRQYFMEGYWPSFKATASDSYNPSGALLKAMMIASTYELTGEIDKGNNGTWTKIDPIWPKYSIFQGFGNLRLGNALKFADDGDKFGLFVDDAWAEGLNKQTKLQSNESETYCVTIRSGGNANKRIRAVLVYDDYPGMQGAAIATVNDLDLVVGRSAEDKVTGNFQVRRDTRNTAEHVIYDVRAGEKIFVQVRAREVPMGSQPYALVIRGDIESVDTTCPEWNFGQDFEQATEADFFPYGQVVGGAMGIMGMIVMLIVAYLKQRMQQG